MPVDEISVVRKFRTTASDGKRYITTHYNLDAIIAVGYRVNSKKATQFRIWATQILRNYIVNGYAINQNRLIELPESLDGLNDALKLIESKEHNGKLTGKMTLKLTKDLDPK